MAVQVISRISRNMIEIFMNDGSGTLADDVDVALFYVQTGTFMLSIGISFIYPVLIKNQIIIPLPSPPERIENLQTAILGKLPIY
jgi:hypothetical protein